ncbi:MAG: MFS transporter [Pseudonocardiaceae bacterium]
MGVSLLALALGGLAIGTAEFATMGVLPLFAGEMRVSVPSAGYAISGYALGVVVGAPLFALLGARWTRKRLVLWLAAAVAVTNLCTALAWSLPALVLTRFACGLPHGAYFGTAAVIGSSLVAPERRARAIAQTMMGLMVANVVGVPAATWLGETFGWRSAYVAVGGVAVVTVVAVAALVPPPAVIATEPAESGSDVGRELSALRRTQVWLNLLLIAAGFGGMFAVYSYIAPILTTLAGYRPEQVPIALAVFGVGMTLGNWVGGRLADWSPVRATGLGLVATAVALLAFTVTVHEAVPATVTLFLIGFVVIGSTPALTTRLMDAACEGRNLAAALYHSAFNVANAAGASIGGILIAAGLGYTAPAVAGAVLAGVGLAVLVFSVALGRRRAPVRTVGPS